MSPRPDDLVQLLEALIDSIAKRTARAVVAELAEDEWIDQTASPLGAKRHAAAIRSGELPGRKVGRQWLARKCDVERFMTGGDNSAPRSRVRTKRDSEAKHVEREPEDVEELAARLGISLGGRR